MSPNKRSDSRKPPSSIKEKLWPLVAIAAIVALVVALVMVITTNIRNSKEKLQDAEEFANRIRQNCSYVGGGFHYDYGRGFTTKWLSLFACPDGKLAIIPQQ